MDEGSQSSSTGLPETAKKPVSLITIIVAVGIQVIAVAVLLLTSALAVGGDGSKDGFVFINGLNLLVVAYTSAKAISFLSSNNSSGAIGVVLLTVPLAFLLYLAIGAVVFGLSAFDVQVG